MHLLYNAEELKRDPSIFDLVEDGPAIVQWDNLYKRPATGAILLIFRGGVGVLAGGDTNDQWRLTPIDSNGEAMYLIPWDVITIIYTYEEYTRCVARRQHLSVVEMN